MKTTISICLSADKRLSEFNLSYEEELAEFNDCLKQGEARIRAALQKLQHAPTQALKGLAKKDLEGNKKYVASIQEELTHFKATNKSSVKAST